MHGWYAEEYSKVGDIEHPNLKKILDDPAWQALGEQDAPADALRNFSAEVYRLCRPVVEKGFR
jgi:hypothetical protein